MRFDLSPLYRSTVGFDRLSQLFDSVANLEQAPSWPPYNIERTAENAYRITMAVAGFGEADLSLEVKEGVLTVTGRKQDAEANKGQLLFQGIAGRNFERRFQLAEYVEVSGAALENGLLHIDLARIVPEAKRPRRINISNGTKAEEKPQVAVAA